MQNIFTTEPNKLTKQEYNRLYYQKNKDRWREKKKPKANVLQLFKAKALPSSDFFPLAQSIITLLTWIELLVLCSLAAAMTFFLVREAAGFYIAAEDTPSVAYLKAGMLETAAILFSLSRGRNRFLRWVQKFIVVLLCVFTLWLMSGKLVNAAFRDTTRVRVMTQELQHLKSELTQKEQLRSEYLRRGWLRTARRYEKGVDQVRNKLGALGQEVSEMRSVRAIANTLGILIAFRLLLAVANLVCVHRIAEQIETKFSIKTNSKLNLGHASTVVEVES